MSLHTEIHFEKDICAYLAAHGWWYAEGDSRAYDTPRSLFPPDVLAWVQATQPDAWMSITQSHGAAAEAMLLDRLRTQGRARHAGGTALRHRDAVAARYVAYAPLTIMPARM